MSDDCAQDGNGELSSETLGVLLDATWRKDEALVGAFDLQTVRAGAIIGASVAVTALFGGLLIRHDWMRFAFLLPLAAHALASIYAVRAWMITGVKRSPEIDGFVLEHRGRPAAIVQDQLISDLRDNISTNKPIVEQKMNQVKQAYFWAIIGTTFYSVLLVIHIFDFH